MEDKAQAVGPQHIVVASPHFVVAKQKRTDNNPSPRRDPAYRVLEIDMDDGFGELGFTKALAVYIQTHTPYIEPGTLHAYQQYGKALCEFYGDSKLSDIGYRGVQAYQLWRSRHTQGERSRESYAHGAGNVRIRNEINGVLKPMLKQAGCWAEIKERKFRHLPVPREGAGTFITPEEQQEILQTAFSCAKLRLAGHILRIMARTGCGVGEIRKLRRRDVDLENKLVYIILGAKNTGSRMRKLTLTGQAVESFEWIVRRWEKLGGRDRNEFILPHRKQIKHGGGFDRPMNGIDRAWTAIKRLWIARHPERANRAKLRLYDFRVSVAVRLLQNGQLSISTIERALGWKFTSAMVSRYYKPAEETLRACLDTLEDSGQPTA